MDFFGDIFDKIKETWEEMKAYADHLVNAIELLGLGDVGENCGNCTYWCLHEIA